MQWYKINIPIPKMRDSGTWQERLRAICNGNTTGQTLDMVASWLGCRAQSVMIWPAASLNMLVPNGFAIYWPYGLCPRIALLNTCEFSWQMFYVPIMTSILGLHCSLGFNLMHYSLKFPLKGPDPVHIARSSRPSFVILVGVFMTLSLKLASYRWCQWLSLAQKIFRLPCIGSVQVSGWLEPGQCFSKWPCVSRMSWQITLVCLLYYSWACHGWGLAIPEMPLRHLFYCLKAKC